MAKLGKSLTISVQVPHILPAPVIVARSNHVATLPSRVAAIYTKSLDVKMFKIPFAFPAYEVSMTWHERTHLDPAGTWLRGFIKKVCDAI
ncbi:MAG: hypothetical protein A3I66_09885 [Burkholderiales bacterium RIFCSPLOWO2_02_FULL_57_36]|nr:MAG: hypothetical protein A3I66_09885 [Burkholderiales bacterium RIFCSPLOWO2_02_FULL_57_36]